MRYGYDGAIPTTDNFITQIIQLENVSVSDISPIVKDLSGKSAKIITYAPTNTLIITDAGVNIKRVYDIISKMDVAAPKSQMRIIPLQHATASDVQQIINDLYGDDGSSQKAQQKVPLDRRAVDVGQVQKKNQPPQQTQQMSEAKKSTLKRSSLMSVQTP